jgi:hypothetical protein
MKAIKSTIGTNHPLVTTEDLSVMFYKIPELHAIHAQFVEGLKKLQSQDDSTSSSVKMTSSNERLYEEAPSLGDLFKTLASRLGAYSAYLKNYSRALETVQKCSNENTQFSEITRVSFFHPTFNSIFFFDSSLVYFLHHLLSLSVVVVFSLPFCHSLPGRE